MCCLRFCLFIVFGYKVQKSSSKGSVSSSSIHLKSINLKQQNYLLALKNHMFYNISWKLCFYHDFCFDSFVLKSVESLTLGSSFVWSRGRIVYIVSIIRRVREMCANKYTAHSVLIRRLYYIRWCLVLTKQSDAVRFT